MSPSSSSEPLPFPESRFISVADQRIHCRIWEPATDRILGRALLIHGFGGSTYSWRFFGPALASWGYFTAAVDLPGFGYSERSSAAEMNDLSWTALIWRLIEKLDELALEGHEDSDDDRRWVAIGHSIGGRVVASMGAQWPERLRAAIFVDAALYGPPAALPLLRVPPVRWLAQRWVQNQLLNERGIARLLSSAYGRTPTIEEVEGYLRPLLLPQTIPVMLRLGTTLPEISDEDLGRINCRALVVWGDQDAWIDMKNALRVFNDLPSAEVFLVPGGGHVPIETHPQQVIERVKRFLGVEERGTPAG